MQNTSIDDDLFYLLSPDEQVLWSGRPASGIRFRGSDLYFIPFSIFWNGFVCFWILGATAAGGCFGLFGIPFLLVGIYVAVGRFFVDAYQRSKTTYALTTDRVIIKSGLFNQQIKSLNLRTLPEITLESGNSVRGTISFGSSGPGTAVYRGMPWPGTSQYVVPTFEFIENAPQVYQQIREVQKNLFKNGA